VLQKRRKEAAELEMLASIYRYLLFKSKKTIIIAVMTLHAYSNY